MQKWVDDTKGFSIGENDGTEKSQMDLTFHHILLNTMIYAGTVENILMVGINRFFLWIRYVQRFKYSRNKFVECMTAKNYLKFANLVWEITGS